MNITTKTELHNITIAGIEYALEQALKLAADAHDGATHGEAVAKSKYETHGLELSYLAQGQMQRAHELATALSAARRLPVKLFQNDELIDHTAVVHMTDVIAEVSKWVFLINFGAGQTLSWQGHTIMTVSMYSPFGKSLRGKVVGDLVVNPNMQVREFEVTAIY